MQEKKLSEKYALYSDEQLSEVLAYPENYTEIAIKVAREEAQKRGLTLSVVEAKIVEKEENWRKTCILANEELSFLEKIVSYFLFFIKIGWVFLYMGHLSKDGYFLKVKQTSYYVRGGLIFMISIGLLLSSESDLTTNAHISLLFLFILGFFLHYLGDSYFNKKNIKKQYNYTETEIEN